MSPASYRAAPPRVARTTLRQRAEARQIRPSSDGQPEGEGLGEPLERAVPLALGDGLGDPVEPLELPDPPWAATARAMASCRSFWAWPYAVKSPALSAASAAWMAASASASALASAALSVVPVPPPPLG